LGFVRQGTPRADLEGGSVGPTLKF
jgi:hypothetical protein